MKNTARESGKPPLMSTPTPSTYRDNVYRSLSAAPVPMDVGRHVSSRLDRPFETKLLGPQQKSQGQVVWSELRKTQSVQKEPSPCPIPLIVANAPHHSVLVESVPVSKVVQAIDDLFKQHGVDAVYKPAKFKWKCVCYSDDVETGFVARLFAVPDKANFFVLDLQRRSGDPFHFQSIYKAINFKLLKSGFVVCNDSRKQEVAAIDEPVFRTFKALSLPKEAGLEHDTHDIDIEPIVRMCNSPYIDVQREGLLALNAQLSDGSRLQKCVVSITPRLMELIALSRDLQVKRLATSALAKAAFHTDSCKIIVEKGGARVLVALLANISEVAETRRQAASILLKLTLDVSSMNQIRSLGKEGCDERTAKLIDELHTKIAL